MREVIRSHVIPIPGTKEASGSGECAQRSPWLPRRLNVASNPHEHIRCGTGCLGRRGTHITLSTASTHVRIGEPPQSQVGCSCLPRTYELLHEVSTELTSGKRGPPFVLHGRYADFGNRAWLNRNTYTIIFQSRNLTPPPPPRAQSATRRCSDRPCPRSTPPRTAPGGA